MELPELIDTIWHDAEIVRNPEGAWVPYSLNPVALDVDGATHSYDFSCGNYGLVCGSFFANLSIVPGHGTIRLEVILAEAGITVRSSWGGRIPVRVVLKTAVDGLTADDVGNISRAILSAQRLTITFARNVNLSLGYTEDPSGPPVNPQITGWLEIVGAEIR